MEGGSGDTGIDIVSVKITPSAAFFSDDYVNPPNHIHHDDKSVNASHIIQHGDDGYDASNVIQPGNEGVIAASVIQPGDKGVDAPNLIQCTNKDVNVPYVIQDGDNGVMAPDLIRHGYKDVGVSNFIQYGDKGVNAPNVIQHYSSLKDTNLSERTKSRIFYLRNLNNWTKSMLIADCMSWLNVDHFSPKMKRERMDLDVSRPSPSKGRIYVLDMCGGKGGDLIKWEKSNVDHVVLVDIAGECVEQARERYIDMKRRMQFQHNPKALYTADFVVADCTRTTLEQMLPDPSMRFNVVSVQFSLHYAFESYAQAIQMIRNISDALEPGGYFIGTTPNSNEIVKRVRTQADKNGKVGNDIYHLEFTQPLSNTDPPPLFGCEYQFHLTEVVDCPEYLVYFPLLIKMCNEVGLKLFLYRTFEHYYLEKLQTGRGLLGRMQALETYPSFSGNGIDLVAKEPREYHAADEFIRQSRNERCRSNIRVGTISQSEWDVFRLYVAFAFQKA